MSCYKVAGIPYSSELYHHGIKGQKWGVRRFQEENGTLTSAGRERYLQSSSNKKKSFVKSIKEKINNVDPKTKKALKTGAKVAASLLVAYGAYKLTDHQIQKQIFKVRSEQIKDLISTLDRKHAEGFSGYKLGSDSRRRTYDEHLSRIINQDVVQGPLERLQKARRYHNTSGRYMPWWK